ncbi:MAG: MlaD family protein [Spirochaetales bacterium]|jgi:phospholipid/cholesterol/gamma-HCH transport system substrate-binding protein|nr:MlaD family protein [Spirochaetales bacterium]
MKFKIKYASQIVGSFVIAAFLFFAAILILMGINQRWFARNYYYTSRFASGAGLNKGMAISFKGFEIGKVTDIYLTKDDNVEIQFYIQDTFQPKVFENSVLQLVQSTFGFGGGLVFHQGVSVSRPLEEFSYIPSLDLAEGQALAARGLVKVPKDDSVVTRVLEDIEPIVENITMTVESLNAILEAVRNPSAGDAAIGGVVKNLEGLTRELELLLAEARPGLSAIVANVEGMSADSKGLVVRLLDPMGSLATLLDDNNRLFEQIEAILADAAASMDEVRSFSSILTTARPQILELLEEGRDAVRLSQDVLEGLRNNPLLRGGIPSRLEAPTSQQGYRDEAF